MSALGMITRKGRDIIVSRGMATGSYVDGYWVEPLRAPQTIIASVQPVGDKELLILPDGDRNKEMLKLYSTFKFQIKDEAQGQTSDLIDIDGRIYEVVSVQDYTTHQSQVSIQYYKAIVARVNENTNHKPYP